VANSDKEISQSETRESPKKQQPGTNSDRRELPAPERQRLNP
jgi:hypothetical protein